ncbi:MAG: hypothetical protein Q4A39_02280 [Eubacteriales bacterium]|nr:hypothetical protein [Eubacteriales bacterium]
MHDYIVTFLTHFGASLFLRRMTGKFPGLQLQPTPRVLSASCGVCAAFRAGESTECDTISLVSALAEESEAEALYRRTASGYDRLLTFD